MITLYFLNIVFKNGYFYLYSGKSFKGNSTFVNKFSGFICVDMNDFFKNEHIFLPCPGGT